MATNVPVTGETAIAIKISVNDSLKKLKLPLKDLTAEALFVKLRTLLAIPSDQEVIFERFSDSAGGYITLDQSNPAVFKTLVRAAKAKLKLRLKATVKTADDTLKDSLISANKLAAQLPEVPKGPVVSRTPVLPSASRMSTTLDGRSGQGIFEFKSARASDCIQPPNEAPVPLPFAEPAHNLAYRTKPIPEAWKSIPAWSIYCNECDNVIANEHFHCGICDGGDFDLCSKCVQTGGFCPGEGHWLVKRFFQNGQVLSSTTERLPPRPKAKDVLVETTVESEAHQEPPSAFVANATSFVEKPVIPSRTCNNCVSILPEGQFVTCNDCDDFDLCSACHVGNKHGHHPAHSFAPATSDTRLSLMQQSLLTPGRNARHHAICDGCNKNIYGVRHKCFTCPDFDYCDHCFENSDHTHAGHRFAPLYEPVSMPLIDRVKHHGILCDGPACVAKSKQTYIAGVRYKCVICHDTDFCADCEASPGSMHNPTHPLIKMKRPIKGLNVSTMNETQSGRMYQGLGDRSADAVSSATPAKPAAVSSTASTLRAPSSVSMRTVADIEPLADRAPKPVLVEQKKSSSDFSAIYVRDTITDGTTFTAGARFTQVWTLRNPGPHAWPAGCSVRYIGGDNMLNLDDKHASASTFAEATESNVIGREVKTGEEVAFKVIMKAPARQGKAISYWRLKAADGTPFGHRLWCDINVNLESFIAPPQSFHKFSPTAVAANNVAELAALQSVRLQEHKLMAEQKMASERVFAEQKMASERVIANLTSVGTHKASDMLPPNAPSYYSQHLERMKAMQNASRENAVNLQSLKARLQKYHHQQKQAQMSRQTTEMTAGHDHWLKQMESFVNQTSSSPMLVPSPVTSKPSEAGPSESKPVVASSVEANVEEREAVKSEEVESPKSGRMVFPTLDKESPASSTYQSADSTSLNAGKAASVEDEETGVVSTATVAPLDLAQQSILMESSVQSTDASVVAEDESEDGFEDVASEMEVLSADGEMSEDDGFLTDEEYDVLDASDQETVASY